jgi:hypothetical protein
MNFKVDSGVGFCSISTDPHKQCWAIKYYYRGYYMMIQGNQLTLDRCPHCSIAKPTLTKQWQGQFNDHAGKNLRSWSTYLCSTCGSIVLVCSLQGPLMPITNTWPALQEVDETIPAKARAFLTQAIASMHAPAGAVMLTASAVDAMLKEKGYKEGSLYSRIDKAAAEHIITQEMAAWAHEIRLEANDQRHADESADLPTSTEASKVIEFVNALAQFLFVLPARVDRGRKS